MNPDTTEQNINQAIDWLQKTGGQIQDFATEQAPLYCREVVAWELYGNIAGAIGCAICIAALIVGLKKSKAWITEQLDDYNPLALFSLIGAGIVLLFLSIGIFSSVGGAIKAAVAPRMVIIEHLRGIQK